jgi:hypothetical protein
MAQSKRSQENGNLGTHRPAPNDAMCVLQFDRAVNASSQSDVSCAVTVHNRRPEAVTLEDEYHDENEVLAAIHGLSDKEIARMLGFARFRLMGDSGRFGDADTEDLFIDAVIRTMEGKRRWKLGVSLFNHFVAVMRSIGHQRYKRASRCVPLDDSIAETKQEFSIVDAKSNVARLKDRLHGDSMALRVLETMMDGLSPRDARILLGMSDEVYWAARKRIRRVAYTLPGAP